MIVDVPLVSVMMPSYNANATLPRAIASLLAQTHENWECLLVDDGSDESPRAIVEAAHDDRIRLIPLDRNYGRGVARQVALEHALGGYLAMLDADDWMYPTRIAEQLAILTAEPTLALVSSAMAIVDNSDEIIGVRPVAAERNTFTVHTLDRPTIVPVSFPASMMRMNVARMGQFNPEYLRAQDQDFLRQVLMRRRFALSPVLHYAYREQYEMNCDKLLESHRFMRASFRGYFKRYPRHIALAFVRSWSTSAGYRLAFAAGLEQRLIAQRSHKPTNRDRRDFVEARARINAVQSAVFGVSEMQSMKAERP